MAWHPRSAGALCGCMLTRALFLPVGLFCAQSLFWVVTKPFLSAGRQLYCLGLIFRGVSGLVTGLNPFWGYTLHGSLPAQRPRKLLVMCNHVSNLDPFITCRALLPWEVTHTLAPHQHCAHMKL